MPGGLPGGGMFKLRFDRYIITCPLIKLQFYFRIKEKKQKYMKYEICKREEKRKVHKNIEQ